MPEHIDTIRTSSYFEGLSTEQLTQVAALATEVHFPRGNTIVAESDPGEKVFYITNGRVDITVSLVGSTTKESIATIGVGEMVGEMILLGKSRRSANIIAKDDVTVLTWKGAELSELFKRDATIGFTVMRNIARHMAERLVGANQVLRNALTLSGHQLY